MSKKVWIMGCVAGGVKVQNCVLLPESCPVEVPLSGDVQILLARGMLRQPTAEELESFGLAQESAPPTRKPSSFRSVVTTTDTEKAKVFRVRRL